MSATSSTLITAADLADLLASDRHVVLLDARFLPGKPSLRPEYDEAHLPGAHFVELSEQLQGAGGGTRGARPLPEVDALQADIERWGITSDSTVVVYSNGTAGAAARAWFVLEWAGVADVRYLDGGLRAWVAAGGSVSTEPAVEGSGTFTITSTGHLPTIEADDAAGFAADGILIDARKGTAFAGDESARSGHIPGAVSIPAGSLLDGDGRLLGEDDLRARFAEHGVESGSTVGVYCGGGVAAALDTLVLRELGVDARLYVASFSGWAADEERPVSR